MLSFWISVVPPKKDRTLNILGSPPDHFGQGNRVGQQDALKSSGIASGMVAAP